MAVEAQRLQVVEVVRPSLRQRNLVIYMKDWFKKNLALIAQILLLVRDPEALQGCQAPSYHDFTKKSICKCIKRNMTSYGKAMKHLKRASELLQFGGYEFPADELKKYRELDEVERVQFLEKKIKDMQNVKKAYIRKNKPEALIEKMDSTIADVEDELYNIKTLINHDAETEVHERKHQTPWKAPAMRTISRTERANNQEQSRLLHEYRQLEDSEDSEKANQKYAELQDFLKERKK